MGEHNGALLELEVTGIAHGGICVARHDNRVVFVSDAIPGERVVARVSDDRKKSYWRADAVKVLRSSEDRVPHVWAEAAIDRDPADRAGGADFGHIALERQLQLKADVLQDALARFGGIQRRVELESLPGDRERGGLGWRTRVRLHVDAAGTLGPFAARSHRVVRVASLPLADPAMTLSGVLQHNYRGESHVDVIATGSTVRLVVGNQAPTTIVETVGERHFDVADTGFWQVHRLAPAALTAAVQSALSGRIDPTAEHLDLYGGAGLLGAALAETVGSTARFVSVESDALASRHARTNLAEWPGATVDTARVDRWLTRRLAQDGAGSGAGAAAVLDPPRTGAGREVLEPLVALAPKTILMVACDPVAFARDAGLLGAFGYELQQVRALDMFPHTHHFETIGVFER